MRRVLLALIVLLAGCGEDATETAPAVPAEETEEAPAEEETASPEPPAPAAEERLPEIMPERLLGPFDSMCAGVGRFDHPDLEQDLECDEEAMREGDDMVGTIDATLDAPGGGCSRRASFG